MSRAAGVTICGNMKTGLLTELNKNNKQSTTQLWRQYLPRFNTSHDPSRLLLITRLCSSRWRHEVSHCGAIWRIKGQTPDTLVTLPTIIDHNVPRS